MGEERRWCVNCRFEDATNRIHENEIWKIEEMDLQIMASFKLTKQSLDNLKVEGVLSKIWKELGVLKDKTFITEEIFVIEIEKTIGVEQTFEYQPLILKHAQITTFPAVWCLKREIYIDGNRSQAVDWCEYFERYDLPDEGNNSPSLIDKQRTGEGVSRDANTPTVKIDKHAVYIPSEYYGDCIVIVEQGGNSNRGMECGIAVKLSSGEGCVNHKGRAISGIVYDIYRWHPRTYIGTTKATETERFPNLNN